jgi:sugar fermentation stimulation protein A
MKFASALIRGKLLRRYKRFLADVILDKGETVTAACPNTGAMTGLTKPGGTVWLSTSTNPARKYPHTWEMVEVTGIGLVGINTAHPNRIVADAIEAAAIPELTGYTSCRREVRYGNNSRIDLLLEGAGRPSCYIEIKNVHLFRENGLAEFPDCVTARGAKHLRELAQMAAAGHRTAMVYLVQSDYPTRFALAGDLDPDYVREFTAARKAGVEAYAFSCKLTLGGIVLDRAVPVEDP